MPELPEVVSSELPPSLLATKRPAPLMSSPSLPAPHSLLTPDAMPSNGGHGFSAEALSDVNPRVKSRRIENSDGMSKITLMTVGFPKICELFVIV